MPAGRLAWRPWPCSPILPPSKNNSYEVHGQITCDVPARSGGHRGIAPIRGVRQRRGDGEARPGTRSGARNRTFVRLRRDGHHGVVSQGHRFADRRLHRLLLLRRHGKDGIRDAVRRQPAGARRPLRGHGSGDGRPLIFYFLSWFQIFYF